MSGLYPQALALAALLVIVAFAAARQKHPVKSGLASVLSGVGALGAVNLLAPFTGVSLALNGLSWVAAVLLGIPGVTTLLLLQVLFA